MTVPSRHLLTRAIVALLESATERPCAAVHPPYPGGDAAVPAPFPYSILYPITGGALSGSFFYHPEEDAAFAYQVTSCGERDDQADALADKVRTAILGRDSGGSFLYPLSIGNLIVQDREGLGSPGGVDRIDMIYQVSESYLVRVSAA